MIEYDYSQFFDDQNIPREERGPSVKHFLNCIIGNGFINIAILSSHGLLKYHPTVASNNITHDKYNNDYDKSWEAGKFKYEDIEKNANNEN